MRRYFLVSLLVKAKEGERGKLFVSLESMAGRIEGDCVSCADSKGGSPKNYFLPCLSIFTFLFYFIFPSFLSDFYPFRDFNFF